MSSFTKKPLATAFGAALLAGASLPAVAETNPFAANELSSGYNLANFSSSSKNAAESEARCGAKAGTEGKCGEAKCGEAKCGADKAAHEGKCGEAKCGGDKAAQEGKCGEGKCGEAKCGADKAASEGKCGEGKCGSK